MLQEFPKSADPKEANRNIETIKDQILKLVDATPSQGISVQEIVKVTGMGKSIVQAMIKTLLNENKIQSIGQRKGTRYISNQQISLIA